jgi:hypothetical protein
MEYRFAVKFGSSRTGACFKVMGDPAGDGVFNLAERTWNIGAAMSDRGKML